MAREVAGDEVVLVHQPAFLVLGDVVLEQAADHAHFQDVEKLAGGIAAGHAAEVELAALISFGLGLLLAYLLELRRRYNAQWSW